MTKSIPCIIQVNQILRSLNITDYCHGMAARIRRTAATVGITEKATRNIINDLEAGGYVTKTREGRRIRYGIDPELPLRHEMHEDKAVGDLLEVLGWVKRRKRAKRSAS